MALGFVFNHHSLLDPWSADICHPFTGTESSDLHPVKNSFPTLSMAPTWRWIQAALAAGWHNSPRVLAMTACGLTRRLLLPVTAWLITVTLRLLIPSRLLPNETRVHRLLQAGLRVNPKRVQRLWH